MKREVEKCRVINVLVPAIDPNGIGPKTLEERKIAQVQVLWWGR